MPVIDRTADDPNHPHRGGVILFNEGFSRRPPRLGELVARVNASTGALGEPTQPPTRWGSHGRRPGAAEASEAGPINPCAWAGDYIVDKHEPSAVSAVSSL
jgi:hypothetical protein